jgi:hypothetical protein
MHGPSFDGDCERALFDLGDAYDRRHDERIRSSS